MKLLTVFHPQTDGQTEIINQKLEQYLRFFIDHRQKNWLEQLVLAEFMVNNKVYSATRILPFMANYNRELRIEINIKRNEKMKKATEFAERIKKVQEKARAALKRTQEEIKQQVDRRRKEAEI